MVVQVDAAGDTRRSDAPCGPRALIPTPVVRGGGGGGDAVMAAAGARPLVLNPWQTRLPCRR